MRLAFYYILSHQSTPPQVRHLEMNRILKTTKIWEQPLQYWEMGHSSYYISRSQNSPHEMTHLDTSKIATIWSTEQENTRSLKKKQNLKKLAKYYNYPSNIGKLYFHSVIFHGPKSSHPEWHISILFKKPRFGLWNWKTL